MADRLNRREFVRDTAVAAAAVATGLTATYTVRAGNPEKADTAKILNYNPDMEYRRCGKTELDDLGRVPGRALEAAQRRGARAVRGRQLARRRR